ncbi:MAG: hypothetical protein R3C52_09125 [Hyphomonadaceae bacterium]
MLKPLVHSLGALPYYALPSDASGTGPRRKRLMRPEASGTFVKPVRQSLFKDARLMPGTLRLICLLAGWQGSGRPVETTLASLARQLQRSERQIQRYLKDAAEEGYLFYSKIANRLGYIVGLRIRINAAAVYAPPRHSAREQGASPDRRDDTGRYAYRDTGRDTRESGAQARRNPATTDESDTKTIISISRDDTDGFAGALRAICERNALAYAFV